jgi:hypothetical protein
MGAEAKFDLFKVIRGVLAASPETNPRNLIYEVFNQIPNNCRDQALKQALPANVRIENTRQARPERIPPKPDAKDSNWSPLVRATQRDPYAARIWVGKNEWKRRGDLQMADVDFLIVQADRLIQAGQEKKNRYERVKQAMIEAGATFLKEVDPDVMVPILQGEVQ